MDDRDGSWSTSPSPIRFWCTSSKKGVTPPPGFVAGDIEVTPTSLTDGGTVNCSISGTSGCSGDLTYAWSSSEGTFDDDTSATPTLTVDAGTADRDVTVDCTVSCSTGESGSATQATVSVTVTPAPDAPVIDSIATSGDTTAGGSAVFTATMSGGAVDTYVWAVTGDSGATDSDIASGQGTDTLTVTIPSGATADQVVTATLTASNVTDSATDSADVTVTALRKRRATKKA